MAIPYVRFSDDSASLEDCIEWLADKLDKGKIKDFTGDPVAATLCGYRVDIELTRLALDESLWTMEQATKFDSLREGLNVPKQAQNVPHKMLRALAHAAEKYDLEHFSE